MSIGGRFSTSVPPGRETPRMRATVTVIVIGMLALGACSSSSKAAAPTTLPTLPPGTSTTNPAPVDFGAEYLRLVAPLNVAVTRINDLDPAADVPAGELAAITGAFETFNKAAPRVPWPAAAAADIRDMVRANAELAADLSHVNDQNAATAGAFVTQLEHDATAVGTDANLVRGDLGLPPAKP